jgi:hypothetical protein
MRVQRRTETTPMTQLNDDTGAVVGREYRIMGPLFTAMAIPNLERLMHEDTVVTVAVEEQLPTMDVLREMLHSLREHNPKRYGNITVRKNQTRRSLSRMMVNAFFGHRVVGEERKLGGKIDRGTVAVMLSLLPAYAAKSGLPQFEASDEVKELANEYLAEAGAGAEAGNATHLLLSKEESRLEPPKSYLS